MLSHWYDAEYDPTNTATFKDHFRSPIVQRLPLPVEQFWSDIGTILAKFHLVIATVLPFRTRDPNDELYFGLPQGWTLYYFIFWSLIEAPFLIFLIFTSIITISILQLLTNIHAFFVWDIIQGPDLQVFPDTPPPKYNPRHRWIYISGVATSKVVLRQNLRVLSETFRAPVLGINNRTYGLLGDLIECVMQRSFNFESIETRLAVPIFKTYLQDHAAVDKVIFIAHSQGGIMASQILDQLYDELSRDDIHSRLEVYTFGNAALHFRNPWLDDRHEKRLVEHMEHYCHQKDLVTQFGALATVDRKIEPFVGRVFVAQGWTGHLLNQHYLKHMFTGPESTWAEDNFLLQRAERDPQTSKDKYLVYEPGTDKSAPTVKELSRLWTYMQ